MGPKLQAFRRQRPCLVMGALLFLDETGIGGLGVEKVGLLSRIE